MLNKLFLLNKNLVAWKWYYGCVTLLMWSSFSTINALTVGSTTSPSRQALVAFPATDTDNVVNTFAWVEGGFTLAGLTTTCTFDSDLPMSGTMLLNGGNLYLAQDLRCSSTFLWVNNGTVFANDHAIVLPKSKTQITLPTVGSSIQLNLIATYVTPNLVNSVDWAFDDSRLVVANALTGDTTPEISVLTFNGTSLTLTNSLNVPVVGVNSVRWHPSSLLVASSADEINGDDMRVFRLNSVGSTFGITDSDIQTGSGYACIWHPSGTFIVGGSDNTGKELIVWGFNNVTNTLNGKIGGLQNIDISFPDRWVNRDCLSFSPGGNFLAVGTTRPSAANTLLLYSFNPTTYLTESLGVDPGFPVTGLDWSPTGSYIAVGLTGSTQNLRIYKHDVVGNTLTEKVTARVGLTESVNSINFNPAGNRLIVGTASGSASNIRVYQFDTTAETLTFLGNDGVNSANISATRWSHDGNYIAKGVENNRVQVYSLTSGTFQLRNVNLVLNSPVLLNQTVNFYGTSRIVGNGHQLTLPSNINLSVNDGASLIIEDVLLNIQGSSALACLMNNASITLRNCTLLLSSDVNFAAGSLIIENNVEITGGYKFSYSSSISCSIASNSLLFLDQGVTFSYSPTLASKNLLFMEDASSYLYLNGCTLYSTITGLRLDRGTVFVDNNVTFTSDGRNLAEGMEIGSNLNMYILSDAVLNMFGNIKYV